MARTAAEAAAAEVEREAGWEAAGVRSEAAVGTETVEEVVSSSKENARKATPPR